MIKSLRDARTEIESAVKADEQQIHDVAAAMHADKAQSDRLMHLAMLDQTLLLPRRGPLCFGHG